jgi:pimeloyl-ACP methyl ester carboxylesterase
MGKAPPPAKKGPKLPEPEDLSLETKDGVALKATYYPGTAKKETVPLIMLHGLGGQRSEYHRLALYLQSLGHASIVPDLRGHGQSKLQKLDGTTRTLESDDLTRRDLEAMLQDVEACKKFLLDKNNEGELNIELLCVVGAEFGSIVAARWAAYDWSVRNLPTYKQGQDVKALVFLSPVQTMKAVTMRDALAHPALQKLLSVLVIVGADDSKGLSEARRIHGLLHGHRPKLPSDREEALKVQDLFLVDNVPTNLSGTRLLGRGLRVEEQIARFLELRLVARKADFPWQERRSPLAG